MVKLVDTIPSEEEIIEQQKIENCDNLKFISVNDPTTTNTLYNSRFTIEKIGQRNKVFIWWVAMTTIQLMNQLWKFANTNTGKVVV